MTEINNSLFETWCFFMRGKAKINKGGYMANSANKI
jgi:hypothetical protein